MSCRIAGLTLSVLLMLESLIVEACGIYPGKITLLCRFQGNNMQARLHSSSLAEKHQKERGGEECDVAVSVVNPPRREPRWPAHVWEQLPAHASPERIRVASGLSIGCCMAVSVKRRMVFMGLKQCKCIYKCFRRSEWYIEEKIGVVIVYKKCVQVCHAQPMTHRRLARCYHNV